MVPERPPCIGFPLVWADTRQELCEGVTYFKSYQSGIYFRHDIAFGYLLDAFTAERDFIGSHVVISHGSPPFPQIPCTTFPSERRNISALPVLVCGC